MPNDLFQCEEIISYTDMCSVEAISLQAGMNFRGNNSVFLMSRRTGAPYSDTFDRDRDILIYEGHDEPRRVGGPDPKSVDQPLKPKTQNWKFFDAAVAFKTGLRPEPLCIRVYEKLKAGIWVFNGTFALQDAYKQESNGRFVVKFELSLLAQQVSGRTDMAIRDLSDHNRMIPSSVKQEVFKRDKGKCVICGSSKNLHFDHDLPFSRGGTSLLAENIRLLCATHNLSKGARIE